MISTESRSSQAPVLAGVDGSERNRAAVRWAALEADRQGVPLRLVCVVDDYSVLSPQLRARSVTPAAERALERAREVAAATCPNLRIDAATTSGVPASELAREADTCSMLVLGRHGAGGFHGLLLGSTTTMAATHARKTVVVVPEDWSSDRSGPVLVGLAEKGAGPVLEQALVEAQRRGVPLHAMHAWDLHPELSWDYSASAHGDLREFEGEVRSRMTEIVAPWTAKFPDVAFELMVRRAHPTSALEEASVGADLLLVGAHHRRFWSSTGHQRLGSIARGVLHHVSIPVMVVRGS